MHQSFFRGLKELIGLHPFSGANMRSSHRIGTGMCIPSLTVLERSSHNRNDSPSHQTLPSNEPDLVGTVIQSPKTPELQPLVTYQQKIY